MRATNLRCEYLTAPLGIDAATPRLSWIVESDQRDDRQTSYRVLAASSSEALAKDVGDLWESGVVTSDNTTAIVYAGKPLTSGQHVWWKVQVADRDAKASAWSDAQSWSMGLLSQDDWKAKWIGFDAGRIALENEPGLLDGAKWIVWANDPKPTPALNRWFRHSLTLPTDVKIASAEWLISADDRFAAEVNGKFVGRGGDWKTPTKLDIRDALRAGENALMIQVTNDSPSPTGLLARLRVIDEAGREVKLDTDSSWAASETEGGPPSPAKELGEHGVGPWGKLQEQYLLPPPAYLRRGFELAKPVKRATLTYATLGVADVYLNGQRATDDYFTNGWTDYRIRSYYRTYDVTDKVRAGANAIGTVVADGWYSGHVGFHRKRDRYAKYPRVRAQLEVEFQDGTRELIATDDTWKAEHGPTKVADMLAGETYDARAERTGWDQAGLDDAAWKPVVVGAEMSPPMGAHPAQPVRIVQTYPAKTITEPTPKTYIVDFGQNLAGVLRLNLRGKAGQTVTIRHGERLNPDGTLYTTNLRGADAIDRYTFRGDEKGETWSPRFTFHGFQYAEITGLDAQPSPESLVALAMTSDAPIAGSFQSSDPMLNQLHQNIVKTQLMNFIDVPTDCPQRDERLGWTGDAQVYIRTASLNVDVQRFFDKWLVDLVDQQRADGQYPCVAPGREIGGDDGGPAWADAGVICPWTLYDVYGDRDVLARMYPSMQKFMDFMVKRSKPDLMPPDQFHCFGDWLSIGADTPKDLIYVAYFAHDADLMQRAATVLGKTEEAKKYGELFERLKQTFRKSFVDANGKIKGDTQCGYVLAIAYDLLDEAGTKEAGRRLLVDIYANDYHLSTGFIGTKDLMLALDKIGRNDVAYRLVHQDTFPSWGFSIRHGATSIWERWNGWTPEQGFGDPGMNSFAHYSFGAVYQWMAETIGGIRNGGDAYKTIVIQPSFDEKLTSAKTSYTSIRGAITNDWKREGDRVTMTVTVPANTTATLRLPTKQADSVRVDGEAAKDAKVNGDRVELTVGSGTRTYEFALR